MSDRYIESSSSVCGIDLFCGAGGLTHGLERAGIDVRVGIDIDPACEYPYTANNKADFLLKSVEEITSETINNMFHPDKLRLLAGCAPCQTFSSYNQKADDTDNRWWLLLQFARLINDTEPEIVTMENVPNLIKQNVFKDFVNSLKAKEYEVSFQIVSCSDYGIPQQRKRLVLLASRLGPIRLLEPSELGIKPKTVREAIGILPPLRAGEISEVDPLHQSADLSPLNMRRMKASKPGGTWRDWDSDLIADCHQKSSGKTYPGVYGRMTWDDPAPTITTQFYGFGNGRFGHPAQDRALSLREGAILQSFPENYQFVAPGEPIYKTIVGRLIGNAVPVKLGEVIGKSILAHVAQFEPQLAVGLEGVNYE